MSAEQYNESHSVSRISLALPAKITGIVFWGMVLVGILVAVYLLNVREKELVSQYDINAVLLAHELENLLETADIRDSQSELKASVKNLFEHMQENYPVEAMVFTFAGMNFKYGDISDSQERINQNILLHHKLGAEDRFEQVALQVHMSSLKQAVAKLRKQMLLSIGSLVFIFGLILQQILQLVLSRPILDMVVSAERFTSDSNVRFDENRQDEFGYLAKFINRALDSMLKQQRELETSKKDLAEEKERAEVTLHSIMDGVITTTASGRIQYMNPVAERLSAWSTPQAMNLLLSQVIKIVHEDTGEALPNPVVACLEANTSSELLSHAALIRKDGEVIPIEVSAAPMRNDDGEVIGAVMVFQDVSHARRLTRQLSYQASHDALTGLYNRRMFEEQLEAALINVEAEDRHHALCYVDLDQFKIVNDTCGHVAGDELLRQLAVLMQECIREGDTLARLGGDEFGVLLENCQLKQASIIADKIRQRVTDFRFVWQNKTFEIGASIGVVAISTDNLDLASIMAAADIACYAAKDMGRNRVHIYEPTDAALTERHGQMQWASRIVRAIEDDRLVLFQQSVVAVEDTDNYQHSEILIRLKNKDGAIIRPDAFIPAAERYNLMPRIDRWVINKAFQFMREQPVADNVNRLVAVNLSGNSFNDDDLLSFIKQASHDYGINLNEVCFEVTETAAIGNIAKARKFMKQMKQEGCCFSLDDFGSGLSSFAYLKNLPVDFIKIDGAFVKDMSTDKIDEAMVEAIIRIGHIMKIKTIAEWVEDEMTLDLLTQLGVDYVQGYHLGKPEEINCSPELN